MKDTVVIARDGRKLAVTEGGDSDGVPVFFHHGTPGSRAAHNRSPDVLAGSRAIFYDRAGYGGSDRQRGRTVGSCAADVAAIADALGVEAFAMFGSSGGGPHALACGALLRDRVMRVAIVAGFAPADDPEFDYFEGMSDGNIAEMRAAFDGEDELTRQLEAFVAATGGDADTIINEIVSELPEPDQRALARPEVRAVFRDAIGASARRLDGWIDDDLAFARPWGFDLGAVKQETLLLQGEHDQLVPRGHMNYIASKLPAGQLEIVPGGGHTLWDEVREVVQWLIRVY